MKNRIIQVIKTLFAVVFGLFAGLWLVNLMSNFAELGPVVFLVLLLPILLGVATWKAENRKIRSQQINEHKQ